jgi:hypothetical protein
MLRGAPPPGCHLGLFGGEKKFDQNNSYETVYRENVQEKPLRTHHDKPFGIISNSSVAMMGIFP